MNIVEMGKEDERLNILFDLMEIIMSWKGKTPSLSEMDYEERYEEREGIIRLYHKYMKLNTNRFINIEESFLISRMNFSFDYIEKSESSYLKVKYGYFNNEPLYIYAIKYYFYGQNLMDLRFENSNEIINMINLRNRNDTLMEDISNIVSSVEERVKKQIQKDNFRKYLIDNLTRYT